MIKSRCSYRVQEKENSKFKIQNKEWVHTKMMHRHWAECSFFNINWQSIRIQDCIYSSTLNVRVTGWKHRSHFKTVTNFIQLVSPQPVNQFSQIKLHWKAQMRAIHIYVGCTKVITNNQDIRPSVTVKVLLAGNISYII